MSNDTTKAALADKQRIRDLALANGFKLKDQGDGVMDLNPYVYDFAAALLRANAAAVPDDETPRERMAGWLQTIKDAHDESLEDLHKSSRSMLRGVIDEMESALAAAPSAPLVADAADQTTQASRQVHPWCPDVCPLTGLRFFMWIEHHKTGQMVPTYGGPYDSYTIPVRDDDGSFCRERYDHDFGGWRTDVIEDIGIQIVSDQAYVSDEPPSQPVAQQPVQGGRDASFRRIVEDGVKLQADHFGNGMGTHLALSDWATKARAALALPPAQPAPQAQEPVAQQAQGEGFRGDDAQLIASINALIELSDEGALVPHGLGGHARGLLSAAASRLARASLPTSGVPVYTLDEIHQALVDSDPDPDRTFEKLLQHLPQKPAAPQPAAARVGLSQAAQDVLAERQRQITAEGWTPEHDDEHGAGDLAMAAAVYALPEGARYIGASPFRKVPTFWPWDAVSWKPCERRRELVKSCALALAEIDRLDRAHGIASPVADGGAAA